MKFHLPVSLVCCLLFYLAASLSANSQEVTFYRYKNAQGGVVISSTIPPQFVRKGYEIITLDGRVIETVPPELSADEKARLVEQQTEAKRLAAWDNELLRRYSHPDDIEDAKQRRLAQNLNAIGILQRSIEKIDSEIVRHQGYAAADEREGKAVNPETLNKIAQLKQDRLDIETEIRQLKQENADIERKFDKDIERFKIIRPDTDR